GAANALSDAVNYPHREDLRPRGRQRDERTRQRRDAVAREDQRPLAPRPIGHAPGPYLDEAVGRLGRALDDAERDRPRVENADQEKWEKRIDELGRRVGGETHPSEEPDGTR